MAFVNKLVKPTSFLHLGGLPQTNSNEKLPKSGFTGCINNLKVIKLVTCSS